MQSSFTMRLKFLLVILGPGFLLFSCKNKSLTNSRWKNCGDNSELQDILVFNVYNQTVSIFDTVWVKKDDIPHFESVDCNASFFHRLTDVRYTHHFIDSIVIKNPSVDYEKTTIHFYVYPKISD